jgi:hypothetical protein
LVTVSGDWHLWVYCCDWLVSVGGKRIGGSSLRQIGWAVHILNGQALIRVDADLRRSRWLFDFDLGARLETRPWDRSSPHYDETHEQWMLFEPSGYVLSVRADGCYSHHPGDTLPDEEVWIPLEDRP